MVSARLRIPTQLITILFLMGSALLLFFIILAGIKSDGNVLNRWYWLAADTSSIQNAQYPISRWSMYGLCGYEKGSSISKPGNFIGCTSHKADYPLDLRRNFGLSEADVWDEFQGNKYYYMTRFQYPFYLISLFFDVVAMFASVLGGNFRSAGCVTSVFSLLTFVFSTIAASLSTAAYTQGRNVFHTHGVDAKISPALYGFAWAVVFMSFVNTVFACIITPGKNGSASSYKLKKKGTPSGKRGGYKFGINRKKTTEGTADNKDASSFVRA